MPGSVRETETATVEIREKTYTRIFPVNVNAIDALVAEKLGNVGSKGLAVGEDGLADDIVGGRLGRVGPAAGGPELILMSVPQFEMHVLWKPFSVLPGPPPSGAWISQ